MEKTETNFKNHFYFLLILTFGVVLRMMYYMGPSGADDMIYFGVVRKLLLGVDPGEALTSSMHWGIRTGLVLPVWLSMETFGVSEFSLFFFPLAASAGVLVFLYVIGTKLFNAKVGLFAALSYSILPQDVYLSTVIYPDGPVVLFSALFVYLFYRISMAKKVSITWSLLTGLILALSYLIRETSLMLLIFVPVFYFLAPNKKIYTWSVAFLCAGLFWGINAEMGLLWGLTDNPFARFEILTGQTNVLTPGAYKFSPRWHSFLLDPFILLIGTYWIAPMILAISLGILLLFSTSKPYQFFSFKKGHFLWMLLITFVIWACYAYTPIIGFTKPLDRSERYFHIMMPFAALAFGVLLHEFSTLKRIKKLLGFSIVAFYIFSCFFSLSTIVNKHSHGLELVEDFMSKNPANSYLIPAHLKPTLQAKHGLAFMEEKITPYPYEEEKLFALLSEASRKNKTQYLFKISKIHEVQSDFTDHIRWPDESFKLITKMNTSEQWACRLVKLNDLMYEKIPDFLKAKVCYTTEVEVYRL